MKTSVNIEGIWLDIEYNDNHIERILHRGEDITDLITNDVENEIIKKIYENE